MKVKFVSNLESVMALEVENLDSFRVRKTSIMVYIFPYYVTHIINSIS
jgi:hypothetical protein